MSKPTVPTYKTKNWPVYNRALKRRGSLTIWFDPEMTWGAEPTGKRGRSRTFSDVTIKTCLTKNVLFGMALRQNEPERRHWFEPTGERALLKVS